MIQSDETPVDIANRLVPLRKVLELTNIYVTEFTHGKSVKARCPYADMYHLNEDASKSMRVYSDTNTGFCYMGCGVLTPVSVHARLNDLSFKEAAFELLDLIGHKLKTLEEKWEEAAAPALSFSREGYRDALLERCISRTSNWTVLQYRDSIVASLSVLLEILDKADNDTQADSWLDTATKVMFKHIDGEFT